VFVSEAFAIASAFCIALSSMFLSELKGRVPLLQLARWQMLAALSMTGLISLVCRSSWLRFIEATSASYLPSHR
jgi:hypothetical protein